MDIKNNIELLLEFITETRKQTLLQALQHRTRYISVMLENIYQPHNASAVLRSCDAYGVQDVHIIEQHNAFKPNQDIAMGSAKWLNIKTTNDSIQEVYDGVRADGYKVVATSLQGNSYSLDKFDINQPSMLVFGSELNGLTDEAIALADETMTIPMFGFVESFNISVSVAIILSNIIPRIHNSDINWRLKKDEADEVLLHWLRNDIHKSSEIEAKASHT